MSRALRLVLAATVAFAAGGCGGSENGGSGATEAGSEGRAAGTSDASVAVDSLVLVMNANEAPLHFTPADWPDLFHFRFADEVLMASPESSPEVRAFMEGVLAVESRRVGTLDAGFDWLRRLDAQVLAYEDEADDLRWRLRQGQAWFALLPASEAGPLLERDGFQLVGLASGFDPTRWESAAGSSDGGARSTPPDVPTDWFARWTAEVRGRG